MNKFTHPPELYEIVQLVKGFVQGRIGREPGPHDVAICLAGALGTLTAFSNIDEDAYVSIYRQSREATDAWVRRNVH